jgi:hypothetical protein
MLRSMKNPRIINKTGFSCRKIKIKDPQHPLLIAMIRLRIDIFTPLMGFPLITPIILTPKKSMSLVLKESMRLLQEENRCYWWEERSSEEDKKDSIAQILHKF